MRETTISRKTMMLEGLTALLLLACVLLLPAIAYPIAFTLPLVVAPAWDGRRYAYCAGLTLAAPVGLLIAGVAPLACALPLLSPILCMAMKAVSERRKWGSLADSVAMISANLAAAVAAIAVVAQTYLDGSLMVGLSNRIVATISQSVRSGNILYEMVRWGFLTVPTEFAHSAAFQLGDFIVLAPALQAELLKMLAPRLQEQIRVLTPMLLMQGSVAVGVFTSMRSARVRLRVLAGSPFMPAFRLLRIPHKCQGYLWMLCVGALLTSFSDNPVAGIVSSLMYNAVIAAYALVGGATYVFLRAKKHPERANLYGVIVALLYVLFPIVLFLLGVVDQWKNLRAASLLQNKEE